MTLKQVPQCGAFLALFRSRAVLRQTIISFITFWITVSCVSLFTLHVEDLINHLIIYFISKCDFLIRYSTWIDENAQSNSPIFRHCFSFFFIVGPCGKTAPSSRSTHQYGGVAPPVDLHHQSHQESQAHPSRGRAVSPKLAIWSTQPWMGQNDKMVCS